MTRVTRRRLAAMVLIDAIGTGLFLAVSAVFLTGPVGLSAGQVGAGLSIAAAIGLVTTLPLGVVADRFGARRVLVLVSLWRAAAFGGYALVHDLASFLIVVCLLALVEKSAAPLTQALVAEAVGQAARVPTMAMLRAVRNVGFTAGGLLGGLALAVDTRPVYTVVILADAASFLASALVTARLPRLATEARPASAPRVAPARVLAQVLRDRPYTALTAVNSVLTLHMTLLNVTLPIWVVQHTNAPKVVVAPLLAVNTVLVVALAVRTSRAGGTRDGAGAAGPHCQRHD